MLPVDYGYLHNIIYIGNWASIKGVTIPRKRLETPKKTEKDFIFNRIMFICYYNPIVYMSMFSKHVFASIFYVNM